jgi:hypothetical protein
MGDQSLVKEEDFDDEALTQYLLGALTEEKTERLDELSIADDEVAARLQVIENDLVDAYVGGKLSGQDLADFESFYLTSPNRRQKVSFARTLLVLGDRAGSALPAQPKKSPVPETSWTSGDASERVRRFRFFVAPRLALQWGFAAATLVLLVVGAYLTVENLRLRNQMAQTQAERGALEQRERELRQELAAQRSSDAETEKELARVRDRLAELEQVASDEQRGNSNKRDLKVIAFNLAPQTRGIGQIPTIAVPAGTDYVALTLQLETEAFTAFRAVLKNPATGQIVWQSGNLRSSGKDRTLRIRLPASLLNSQNYLVELSGVSSGGVAEIVSSYSFRVLTQ